MTLKDKIITTVVLAVFTNAIFYFMPGKRGNINTTKTEIRKLGAEIDSLQKIITAKIDTVEVIKTQKKIVKQYYEDITTKADTIKTDTALIAYIRMQLKSLGSARFQ